MPQQSSVPQHSIAVSACVKNNLGEVLIVKTHYRPDTWELPGGYVEEGEPLDQAVCRELLEETNLVIKPIGVTGIYYNTTSRLLSVVFHATLVTGELKTQLDEIAQAQFVCLDESNINEYIVRPHMRSRALDAILRQSFVPYESWKADPMVLIARLD